MRCGQSGAARARRYFEERSSSFIRRRGHATRPPTMQSSPARSLISCSSMRIVSLVPSATEMLFALGPGRRGRRRHARVRPPAAGARPAQGHARRDRPRASTPAEIDRAVRELTEQGQRDLRARRGGAARRSQPDLIVTQALCAVCAVSYDDVEAVAERLDPTPQVISLDPHTLGEVLGDVRTLAQATDAKDAGVDLVQDAAAPHRPRAARGARRSEPVRGRRARVARPGLRRRPLDAAADRVRRRRRRARPARRALRGALVGGGRARRGPRSSS